MPPLPLPLLLLLLPITADPSETTTTPTKCEYSLVIQEPGDCPQLTTSRRRMAYLRGVEELVERVGQLETKLYAEVAHNRQLQTSVLLHEHWLQKTDRTVQAILQRNLTVVAGEVEQLVASLERQADRYRSVDTKLSEVMLDVAELRLARQQKQSGAPQKTKHIAVQATSQLRQGCARNGTKFKGK